MASETDTAGRVEGSTLLTEDWIKIAKDTLIREGINAVKVDRLAKECGVTRGGFYWRFKSRAELLDVLLDDWRRLNTKPILSVLASEGTPRERFERLVRLWVDEREFSPEYDTAIRNWSHSDPKVAAAVHEIDDLRIRALWSLFLDFGYSSDEANVRARITYFRQVGYYALDLRERDPERAKLETLYIDVLTGTSQSNAVAPTIKAARKPRKHAVKPAKTEAFGATGLGD